ncbi:MAG: Hsp33 family molecular chaperone HslO [bacterium]|jgi:molecular chaperone Hsp33
MRDYLVRATGEDGTIRAVAAVTTELVDVARLRHDSYPTATAALGRTLTAAAFLGTALKDDGTVTVRIGGDGPIGGIVAQAERTGGVRGYPLMPHVDLPLTPQGKLDVGGAVGKKGHLYVTYDQKLKEPYTGVTELVSGEIAEDFTHYFSRSEQIPSAVALGVKVETDGSVRAAGGYMVQLLPGAGNKAAAVIEDNVGRLGAVTSLLEEGFDPETILSEVLAGCSLKILGRQELSFRCRCSKERAAGLLQSLGREELAKILAEEGGTEVRCHFCNTVHRFPPAEIAALLDAQPD